MKTHKKYFLLMLITISILQPGCKHDHHTENSTSKEKHNSKFSTSAHGFNKHL